MFVRVYTTIRNCMPTARVIRITVAKPGLPGGALVKSESSHVGMRILIHRKLESTTFVALARTIDASCVERNHP